MGKRKKDTFTVAGGVKISTVHSIEKASQRAQNQFQKIIQPKKRRKKVK